MADNALLRSQPPFPEKVGKYELLLPIGTGGMATVYLARSKGVGGFERDVALKLVHSHLRTDEESKLQLLEEAKLAARIRHPNVVPVLEVDEDPLGLFLVMDYVEGDTLSGLGRICRAAGKAIPLPLIGRILNDALLGLEAAHQLTDESGKPLNLVHRDFSPQNILVSTQGITRLADFGVAKAADRAVRTKTGLVKGKISYMSPEQARGQAVDRRCDVWAAGVVAWELVAGKRMHRSDDDVATLLSIVTEDPPKLDDVVPHTIRGLSEAISAALTPDVNRRCPTAEAFRKSLLRVFEATGGIADAQDLARFVQQMVGPKLEERRAAVAEVRTLRRRMDELARSRTDDPSDAEGADPPTPGNHRDRAAAVAPASAVTTALPAVSLTGAPLPSQGLRPSVGPLQPEELTQTSAVVAVFQAVRRDRKRAVLGTLAALTFLAAIGLAISEGTSPSTELDGPTRESPPSVALAAESPPGSVQPLALEGSANPPRADTPSASESERATTPSAKEVEPAVRPHRPRRPVAPPVEPPGPTVPKKPKLADSPYVTPKSKE
jgi:eukaryotic-like serine/threonine-protein kinase